MVIKDEELIALLAEVEGLDGDLFPYITGQTDGQTEFRPCQIFTVLIKAELEIGDVKFLRNKRR